MTKKIFSYIFCTTLISILIVSSIIVGILFVNLSEETKSDLNYELNSVSIELTNLSTTEEKINYLSELSLFAKNQRFTLINFDGKVLFDSQINSDTMENHLERPEIKNAIKYGKGESERYSNSLEKKSIYKAILLKDNTILRIAVLQNSIWFLVFSITRPVLIFLFFFMILCGVLSFSFSKKIITPIVEIDLDNISNFEKNGYYEELSPFIKKIKNQQNQINENLISLKNQQAEFESITSKMKEGLIIINSKCKILSINKASKKLLNISLSDFASGFENVNIFNIYRSSEFSRIINTILETGNSFEYEEQVENRDLIFSLNPVHENEEITGITILIRDITEKSQNEKMRREFSANVSHELKTPLTSILGFSEIIKSGLAEQKDIPKFAEKIHVETSRMIQLVQDIINLSNLDENVSKIDLSEKINLKEVIFDVKNSLENAANKKNVSIDILIDENLSENDFVLGNKRIIEEMVFNLCDNAIKYNKEKGNVLISLTKEGKNKILKVKDTGIGIPKNEFENIFQRFYRIDKSRSKQSGGTGLGLSIVKHAAKIHNAKIKVESVENEFTEILIEFL